MMNELLHKYFTDTLTEESKRVLFDELDRNPVLLEEFVRMQATVTVAGVLKKETNDEWSYRRMKEVIQKARVRKKRRLAFSVFKYAAVAALLAGVWFFSDYYHTEKQSVEYTIIEVPKGQRAALTLPDGSEAILSSRTKMKFSNQFNRQNRTVELDGEAYFSVEKNADIPFIVAAGEYNVEVTGTRFNVFAYSQSELFETDLVEGSVFIYKTCDKEQELYLSPDEKAFLSDGVLQKSRSRFIPTLKLRDGIYSFEDSPLQEILNRLALWYDIQFEVRDPRVLSYILSGKFHQSDDINLIMTALKKQENLIISLQEQIKSRFINIILFTLIK